MSLSEIKNSFQKENIDKWQYIDEMYMQHALLFDYSKFIKNTNISAIELVDDKVIMTFRDSGVRFICIENDKRLAPLDTLNFGSYEIEELYMQLNLMDDRINVFDVGANLGWYALHVAKAKPSSNVFSFEPVPSTYKYLNDNIALNGLSNIQTFNFGLSDSEGEFSFYFDPELSVNASLTNVSGNENIKEVTCKVKMLDTFTSIENSSIDFIKCDVEGAELLAFKGGMETIKKHLPIVFTEMLRKWTSKFNYHPNDIISLFTRIGYECFVITEGKLKKFTHVDEYTIDTNYFFLHSKKHASKISNFLIK